MVMIDIPEEYGYVVLIAGATNIVNIWLSINVGRARKQFNIKYPAMYSDTNNVFNCIQRAHQNFLEIVPQFLAFLLLGGIQYPVFSAGCGAVFLTARIVYALGYYSGDPAKRNRGAFQYFGLFGLLYSTIRLGTRLIGWF